MSHALVSPGPIVTPNEKFAAANSFLSREANRFSIPFVSIEKSQKPEANRVVGNTNQPLFVPVIVGAVRQNRMAVEVAQFIAQEITKRQGVETALISVADTASAELAPAETMILVLPEYNYGLPDGLKNALDSLLPNPGGSVVGICDLSPGWFGGSRLLESLLPMMRKSGLIPIFWDENLAKGREFLGAAAAPVVQAQRHRLDNFLQDLLWMAASLRQRGENMRSN